MVVLRCAALVIALAGCSKLLGFKEVALGDGGVDAGTDAGPLVAPPDTVVGKIYTRCHQLSGEAESPADVSQSIIQALIFDDSRRVYRTVDGVGKSDGTFRIDGVPDGVTYMFRFGTLYYVTDQHVIHHAFEQMRRCDPNPNIATTATPIAWNLTGMTPFHAGFGFGDQVHIVSFGLPYRDSPREANVGETVFHPTTNWAVPGGPVVVGPYPLLDASAGDDLYVLHTRTDLLPDAMRRQRTVTHLLDWAQPTSVTLQDGVSASITGAFQPIVANKKVSFTVDRALFDAGAGGMSEFRALNVRIVASPALVDSVFGESLASFVLDDFTRTPDLRHTVSSYGYGDPFPDSWKRYSVVEYSRTRYYQLPEGGVSGQVVFNRQVAEYTTTINTTPVLQPPTGARIGGTDFDLGGKVAFDGTSPVEVTWNPVLSARTYRFAIFRAVGGSRQSVASIRTTSTSLRIRLSCSPEVGSSRSCWQPLVHRTTTRPGTSRRAACRPRAPRRRAACSVQQRLWRWRGQGGRRELRHAWRVRDVRRRLYAAAVRRWLAQRSRG